MINLRRPARVCFQNQKELRLRLAGLHVPAGGTVRQSFGGFEWLDRQPESDKKNEAAHFCIIVGISTLPSVSLCHEKNECENSKD
jgi:hypothetical protein